MLKYIYRKRDGGCHGQHAAVFEKYDFPMCAVQSDNSTLLSWCEKKRLLSNGDTDHAWGLYYQSIVSNCTRVRSWLYKHGYTLPAGDENFAAMMARHADDDQTADNHEDSDLTSYSESDSSDKAGSSSSSSISSNNSSDSDDNEQHDSSVQDDSEAADDYVR
jgi:hypothetical protein